jgi:Na+/proline symporter
MLLLFIICYLGLTLGISVYAHTKINNSTDFISAGRSLPAYINTGAFFALWFGSETVFGASSEFVTHGFRGIIEDPFGGVLCLLLVGLVFAKKLYNLNIITIGDLFHERFGRKVELLASGMMTVSFLGYCAAQMVALGLLFSSIFSFVDLNMGILVGAIIVVFYTFWGGMLAISLNDFIQSLFIIVGLVAVAYVITKRADGFENIINSLPKDHYKFLPEKGAVSTINWFSAWAVLGLGSIVSQDVFQRLNSAKSANTAQKSAIMGGLIYGLFAMFPLYIVSGIQLLYPQALAGDVQLTLPRFILDTMPMTIQVLFFGSLLSAILSTCSGSLLAPATLISENILTVEDDEPRLLVRTKVAVIIVGIMSTFIAYSSQNIFELVGISSIFGLVSIFVPFCAVLFTTYNSKIGAVASMVLGTLVWLVCYYFETEINPLVYGVIASVIGLFGGRYVENKFIKVV